METFLVGGTLGIDADDDEGSYLQLLYLLNFPKQALPVLTQWLTSSVKSTQLMGLLGLYQLDRTAFRRFAPRYTDDTTPLWEGNGGDTPLRSSVRDVTWKIAGREYQKVVGWGRERYRSEGHYLELAEATPCFSLGWAGVGRIYTKRYRAFLSAFFSPDAVAQLTAMVSSSDGLDRLYGLLGLHLHDRAAFSKALPEVKRLCEQVPWSQAKVPVVRGFSVARMPLAVLLAQLEGGGWDASFLKSLNDANRDQVLTTEQKRSSHAFFKVLAEQVKVTKRYFSVQRVGFEGRLLERHAKLLARLRHPDAVSLFKKALSSPDDVERLYACLGLRLATKNGDRHLSLGLSNELLYDFTWDGFVTPRRIQRRIEAGLCDRMVRYELRHPHP